MSRIRVACVGVGNISPVHLDYLRSRSDVEICALCDIRDEQLRKRQAQYGGQIFSDYGELIKVAKPDALWLCTPPQVRRDPLLACAERGIPVFCEKPVERDPAKANRIARELKRRKAKVQVGYVFRSMPTVLKLADEIKDDKIHLVQSLYGCGVSLSMNLPAWFYDKKLSGGALIDQATHNLDLLRRLLGEVSEVRGVASNPVHGKKKGYTIDETLSLGFVFKSGAVGGHVHTWVGDKWRNEVVLSGEKRLYRIDLGKGVLTVEEGGTTTTRTQNQAKMYEHENKVFLDMVRSGGWSRNPCEFEDAVKSLELTLACDKAVS
ncbi:MAG: hypothetical protein C0404_06305 [Verrucomicrobia bacterium]|nr:hypothetical protein [Verrucomicrobiota bacterium]